MGASFPVWKCKSLSHRGMALLQSRWGESPVKGQLALPPVWGPPVPHVWDSGWGRCLGQRGNKCFHHLFGLIRPQRLPRCPWTIIMYRKPLMGKEGILTFQSSSRCKKHLPGLGIKEESPSYPAWLLHEVGILSSTFCIEGHPAFAWIPPCDGELTTLNGLFFVVVGWLQFLQG